MSIKQHKTAILRSLMQQAEIPSFRALSRSAEVSEWQVEQLRRGKAAQMRVEALARLSQALQISLAELIQTFAELPPETVVSSSPAVTVSDTPSNAESSSESNLETNSESISESNSDALRQEYDRLQAQLERQAEELQRSFQQTTLQILESWLIQFPSLVYAAQQNPQFPAKNFLIFMRPIEQLMQAWGIESIAAVGAEVPYDPQLHQLMAGHVQAGDRVRVRFTGYRQGETLLYRARVSPVQ
ncbi:helix-turn-helix domain-containing protein [Egbenema bharatensis]|uniref:helix-turn-helix domain-containing protein n=1 Tax=Egbenema bharatensis TaxID=3463334 RepID=UPI003A895076